MDLDVKLLADVMNNFRTNTYNDLKMESCFFVSMPGLSWEA